MTIQLRSYLLALSGCLLVFRYLLLLNYLLRRAMSWDEILGAFPMIVVVLFLVAFFGGTSTTEVSILDFLAFALYLLGSYLNSYSELQRHWWKKNPENKGKLYTEKLFSLSQHINYFGDSLLYTALVALSRTYGLLVVPVVMTFMFIFAHIPALDSYLA
eukprot:CAMPEP_0174263730 /NCGR_PEP_ID=MMETSP0439-20130205/19830_1 /TAXON_ID=0 /ORGANISM="Stereomyxa ramosa, Strain Chinc5" /LENGTH=158 /DNA_ID=CAMNT_0015349241 /DNA_START=220 /DNA_END=693 /DNA_ORIENTATION=+